MLKNCLRILLCFWILITPVTGLAITLTIDGSIEKWSEVNQWYFTLSEVSDLTINALAYEHYYDPSSGERNSNNVDFFDGIEGNDLLDTAMYLFDMDNNSTVGFNDDTSSNNASISGWTDDGSLSNRDAFLRFTNLAAGDYMLAIAPGWTFSERDALAGLRHNPLPDSYYLEDNNDYGPYRLTFESNTDSVTILTPVPSTIFLFGTGLIGFWVRRKKYIDQQ